VTERLLTIDKRVCTFCSKQDVFKILLFYFFGLLPYLKIDRDVASLPYMTRDFIKMKFAERENAKTMQGYIFLTLYLYCGQFFNMIANPAIKHL